MADVLVDAKSGPSVNRDMSDSMDYSFSTADESRIYINLETNGIGSMSDKTPSRPQSIDKHNVHTKTPIAQYGDITFSEHSSDSQSSQIPNQSFIEMLDRELHNQAKDTYIETLLDLTDATDNLLTWYRTLLTSRARGLDKCPNGKLTNRKTTKASTSSYKYARDCYIINQFILGDSSEIHEVFSKSSTQSVSGPPQEGINSFVNTNIDLNVLVHSLVDRIDKLESNQKERKKLETQLKSSLKDANELIAELQQQLLQHMSQISPKVTNLISYKKTTDDKLKSIGEFDFEIYKTKITHLEEGIQRCTKSTNGSSLRKSTVTNKPQSEPQNRNFTGTGNNIPIIVSERISSDLSESPIREIVAHTIDNGTARDTCTSRENDHNIYNQLPEVNVTVSSDNCKYNQQDKSKPMKTTSLNRSIDMITNKTRSNPENLVNNEANINYKIPVCIDRSSADPLTTDESSDVFFGVVRRKRTSSFYIGNIDQKSTKSGIVHYIESKGPKVTHIAIFSGRNGKFAAKINVDNEHAELLDQPDFWPNNVRCRKWMSNNRWKRKLEQYDEYRNGE